MTPSTLPAPPPLAPGPAVHHLAVVVADLDRAERFYVGVLGLPIVRRHVDDAGEPRAVWVGLGGDGAFLAIERASVDAPRRAPEAPGFHCLALPIERGAREIWRQHLTAAGHPVVRETTFTLYFYDPDGQLVALSHHPTSADP